VLSPFITIKDLKKQIKNKEISIADIKTFYEERIKKYNPTLNVLVRAFSEKMPTPTHDGKLAGIPCLVKDNLCVKNVVTSAGSKILKNFVPCYSATVVENIRGQGGLILGHANMDEFAMGSSGEFSAYGPSKNPWNLNYAPGGSSSGIAAAVAAGLVPWGLGSETGGSVRQPAAFCGLVGLYPTYGLLSRYGLIAFASSTDQPGPITRTVYDCAIALSVLAGHDSKDATSLPEPKIDYTKKLDGKLPKGLKIGIIRDSFNDGVDAEIRTATENAVRTLEGMGATVRMIDLPSLKHGIAVYFIISRAEAASNLARIDGTLQGARAEEFANLGDMYLQTRELGFGPEVKRRILLGNYVLSSEHRDVYNQANFVRSLIRTELETAFDEVDVLLSPTTSTLPFALNGVINDPLALYMADYFTVPNCVAGYPALSVPAGMAKSNLPIGVQFIGNRLCEELLLAVGYAFEQSSGYCNLKAKGWD